MAGDRLQLAGATALVTGASGGLGRHIARALAAEGMTVALSGRDVDALDALAQELPHARVVPADLADPEQAATLIERTEAVAGPVDVLVSNAGIEIASAYERVSDADLERIVAVNVLAGMILVRHALVGMLARGRGHVVLMSSVAGKGGVAYAVPYGTTKAALVGLGRSLRIELAGTPVGASVICPGFVRSDGMYAQMQTLGLRAPLALSPVTPERVAAAVVSAIHHDRPETIITTIPLRPLAILEEIAPRLAERVVIATGARSFYRELAKRRSAARSPAERR